MKARIKNKGEKVALKIAYILLLLTLISPSVMSRPVGTIEIDPADTTVAPPDVFDIDIVVDDNILGLKGFNIQVTFDPAILSLVGVSEGPLLKLGGPTFWKWRFIVPNTIEMAGAILGVGLSVNGPGVLATITFEAVGYGVSPITFASIILRDSLNNCMPCIPTGGIVGVPGSVIPTLIAPKNLAMLSDNTPKFVWSYTAGPGGSYTLQYASNSMFTLGVVTITGLADTTYTPPSALEDTTYYWHVKVMDVKEAIDKNGMKSSWSTIWSFTIDSKPPSIPVLIHPPDSSFLVDRTPTFVWHKSTDAYSGVKSYEIMYANNPEFSGPSKVVKYITDTTYTPSSPITDDIIYWVVKAIDNAKNHSFWSTKWYFTYDSEAPLSPTLISPIGDTCLNDTLVVLQWIEVNGGTPVHYILEVADNISFLNPIIDTIDTNSHTLLLGEEHYYWRVRAYDDAGNQGSFSSTESFGIDITRPSRPTLVSPPDSTIQNNPVLTLIWNASTDNLCGFDHYVLEYAPYRSFAFATSFNVMDTCCVTDTLPDGTWWWHVKAVDRAGNESPWSTRYCITIDTEAPMVPALSSPLDSSWINTLTPTFTWRQVTLKATGSMSTNYCLQVALDTTSLVIDTCGLVDTFYTVTDSSLLDTLTYYWRVEAIDKAGNHSGYQAHPFMFEVYTGIIVGIPDTSGAPGDTVIIPINVSDVTGQGVVAADIILTFDSGVLTALNASLGNVPVAAGWTLIESNPTYGQIKISIAGAYPLSGSGSLVTLFLAVSTIAEPGATCTIYFTKCKFNEGLIPARTHDGLFTVRTLALPDLVIKHILPSNLNPHTGDSVNMTIKVANQGYVTSTPCRLDFYYDLTSPPILSQYGDQYTIIPALAPGQTWQWTTDPFTSTSPSTWHTYGQVDTDNEVSESNETNNLCGPVDLHWDVIPAHDISGYIRYYGNSCPPVADVTMTLAGAASYTTVTDANGYYIFSDLTGGVNYTVTPSKINLYNDPAIKSYDASLVIQHTVDLITLGDYQQIAGDVSEDGTISSYDASFILCYAALKIERFPVGDWAFVPHSRGYTPLNFDQTNQDYVAILYGDVTGNWTGSKSHTLTYNMPEDNRTTSIMCVESKGGSAELYIPHITGMPGDRVVVPINIRNATGVISADITMTYDSDILIPKDVSTTPFTKDFLIAYKVNRTDSTCGQIKIGLAGSETLSENGVLVKITFDVVNQVSPNDVSILEIINAELNEGNIPCSIASGMFKVATTGVVYNPISPKEYMLCDNQPNPFTSGTTIEYVIPRETHVILKIYDVTGKTVRVLVNDLQAPGHHTLRWNGKDKTGNEIAPGVYFCRLVVQPVHDRNVGIGEPSGLTFIEKMVRIR